MPHDKKLYDNTHATTFDAIECCYDLIRAFNKDCRVFRQLFLELKKGNRVTRKRLLREFIPILKKIEREAGTAMKVLEERAPTGKPLTNAELATYLATRKVLPHWE